MRETVFEYNWEYQVDAEKCVTTRVPKRVLAFPNELRLTITEGEEDNLTTSLDHVQETDQSK